MRTLATGVEVFSRPGRERVRVWWLQRGAKGVTKLYETLPGIATSATVLRQLTKKAIKLRAARVVAAEKGEVTTPARVRFEDLMTAVALKYETKGWRLPTLTRLRAHFAGWRAVKITFAALEDFVVACQRGDGDHKPLDNGSISVMLGYFRSAFKAAQDRGLVGMIPRFPSVEVANRRTIWFEVAELDELVRLLRTREHMPHLAAACEFAFSTGWRQGNIFALCWPHVDFDRGVVVAPAGTTKNGDPFITPFGVDSPLNAILRAQHRATRGLGRVFPVERKWRRAWARSVGPKGLNKWGDQQTLTGSKDVRPRFHDLRHSFMQHMLRTGVEWQTTKALGGWRSDSAAQRYGYEDERIKRAALARRDAHVAAERAAATTAKQQVVSIAKRK
ncbi:MAG: hypothetical protein DMD60_14230, partial [Gemmatimonadetes bacterium]